MPNPSQANQGDEVDLSDASQSDNNQPLIADLQQRIIQQGREIHDIWQEQLRMQQYQMDCFNTFALYFQQMNPNVQFKQMMMMMMTT